MKRMYLMLAVLGMVGLAMWGWAHAQESNETTNPPAPTATFDSLYEQGKQLKIAGNYEAALPLLLQALEMDPNSEPVHILAGVCLKEQGQVREALGHFETVVAGGKGFRATALYCAAECHRALGETADALVDLKAAHEDSPIDKWGIKAVGLMAEIQGRSSAEAIAREEQAAALYRAARDRGKETHYKSPEPLAMFDQVINQFSGTGGAYCALSQKAELLWHLSKREEMCKTYEHLRVILRGYAESEKVRLAYRTMDCRIGQHRAEQMMRQLSRDRTAGKTITPQQWDQLNVFWRRWHHNADGATRASAELFAVCITSSQGKDVETVAGAEALLKQHYEPNENKIMDPEYKDVFAGAHLLAGRALKKLNRYDEALAHFYAMVDMSVATPPFPLDKFYGPSARYEVCHTLRKAGAERDQLQQAVDSFAAEYPGHRLVEAAQRLVQGQ
ncbi:MAG: tetratricopeptide repeat protein [Phycisphaerae bacterium]|jgi:tetratricopeptide (TPR) repeat protein|nr:tetratricopeptide repeat protein [Phycisphaerae bacterium]